MNKIEKNGSTVYPITVPTPYDVGDVNMYLLEANGALTLIDAGIDTDECWDAFMLTLTNNGYSLSDLSQIWITHNHQDHIGLINRITTLRQMPVYAHQESIPRLTRDPEFLSMRIRFFDQLYREMGCGAAGEQHILKLQEARRRNDQFKIVTEITSLSDSDDIGGFQVMEVPGHAPDHIAFWDAQRKLLFAGDHLLRHISSNAFIEPDLEGNRKLTLVEYAHSLKKCLFLDMDTVFPGHGELIRDSKDLIDMRLTRMGQKAEKIRSMIQSGGSTAYELAQSYYPTKYVTVFAPVMSEIIGMLDYLESHDRIQKMQRNGIWYYEQKSS
ncbi:MULTISPECIES: MBL fold metallo-hydrolase [unclassified Paenibacillus]|uniref:MBL fold metallo-hydrolase n=1 Tax=unclassified Paenibacillus TaxID=185978 RepID=UPI001AEA9C45|nr:MULTISPECIES: MBL fold metallo-hydrolase [unclassified Paenibacillus]MBP1156990.1 glyoxylase-like metal-dependent hydrolase (beta-lactamase superfamily II) [Paenibacillus sp. PvP091]MBP1172271.1 glyoxylase-like metal-dependent hydrolase (beta-lactamase superfamily II) [Paenibacillus sp. PvR098]MBP2438652.1 glyoxylase-like metal-dependent hydrolase (beta-lactamase superfamily II) [Paenibacillus sp. PvP052]